MCDAAKIKGLILAQKITGKHQGLLFLLKQVPLFKSQFRSFNKIWAKYSERIGEYELK
jgi:hypothetical protein